MVRIALFQPDIPQNTGTILRLAACMDVGADIIEPCGFVWSENRMKRAGMDYLSHVDLKRHRSWKAFEEARTDRLLLLTTRAETAYTDFTYQPGDILLLGQESSGAPPEVHDAADHRLTIPMASGMRSINIAISAAMVLGEALRQTNQFPTQ